MAAVVEFLRNLGVLDVIREQLKQPGVLQAIGRGVLATVTAMARVGWPVVVGLFFYWLLRRELSQLVAAHIAPPRPLPPQSAQPFAVPVPHRLNQDNIANWLQARVNDLTLRGWSNTFTAEVELCSLRELPAGAEVVKWWAMFTTNNERIDTRQYEESDIYLNPIGCTRLGDAEAAPKMVTGDLRQQRVAVQVYAVIRIPSQDNVKFSFGVRPQVAALREQP